MHGQSKNVLKRAYHHLWADGIIEICIGIGVILLTLIMANPIKVSENETVQLVFSVVLLAIIIFVGILTFRIIAERLKTEITYPRTGYVSLKRQRPPLTHKKLLLGLSVTVLSIPLALGVTLGALIVFSLVKINASLLILSAMLAGPAAIRGKQTNLPRLYMVAGAIIVIGIVLTATDTFGSAGIFLLYGLSGLVLTLSGAFALARYLRMNPVTHEDAA